MKLFWKVASTYANKYVSTYQKSLSLSSFGLYISLRSKPAQKIDLFDEVRIIPLDSFSTLSMAAIMSCINSSPKELTGGLFRLTMARSSTFSMVTEGEEEELLDVVDIKHSRPIRLLWHLNNDGNLNADMFPNSYYLYFSLQAFKNRNFRSSSLLFWTLTTNNLFWSVFKV